MRITHPVWVVLISSIKKGLLTNWTVSHLAGIFDLMDVSVVNSHGICKVLHTKGMELLLFKIVLDKSLIVLIIVAVEIQRSIMCLTEKYFRLVSHYTF